MHLLGIGNYEPGVTTKALLQMKDKAELPDYYQLRKLSTTQTSLGSVWIDLFDFDQSIQE